MSYQMNPYTNMQGDDDSIPTVFIIPFSEYLKGSLIAE